MKKGHKRQSGFSSDKQWNGKFERYKLLGRLFKVAGAADKAGLSKAIELSNVKNHRRPNFRWAKILSKLRRSTERGRPKLVHNSNLGIKENIKILAKRSELRKEMDFHLKMFPISTESIQDGDRRKLSQNRNFSGQNGQRNQ